MHVVNAFQTCILILLCIVLDHCRTCNNAHILVLRFAPLKSPAVSFLPNSGCWQFSTLAVTRGGRQQADGSWQGGRVECVTRSFRTRMEAQSALQAEQAEAGSRKGGGGLEWECSVDEFLSCAPEVQQAARMFQPPHTLDFHQQGVSLDQRMQHALHRQQQRRAARPHSQLTPSLGLTAERAGEAASVVRVRGLQHAPHRLPCVRRSLLDKVASSTSRSIDAGMAGCFPFRVEKVVHADYFGFQLDGNGRCLMADFTVTHNVRSLSSPRGGGPQPAEQASVFCWHADPISVCCCLLVCLLVVLCACSVFSARLPDF